MFGIFKGKNPPSPPPKPKFPPVPDWKPGIPVPLDQIEKTIRYYTDNKRDFALFKYGTFVVLPANLNEQEAISTALESLRRVFHAHPDMNPRAMDDGNILVGYNHNAGNIVLSEVVANNWSEIQKNHQLALATSEVLITPLGHNKFDEFGMKALFGRCYLFMDAQSPEVVKVVRYVA